MHLDNDSETTHLPTSKRLEIIRESIGNKGISINELLDLLLSDGIHIIVIILIAPFLLPVSIPGSSTPFGILIILLELSVLFNRKLYLPKMVSEYKLPAESVESLFDVLKKALGYIERISHPRGSLTKNRVFIKINSVMIIILSGLLFLPLPIPFTDFFPAVDMLLLTVSSLEEDSYLLVIGYIASILTGLYFMSIGYIGIQIIESVIEIIFSHFR
ncbi:exopolysaccharide biosynthesis protein [uncultured Methanobrevibacter sp.]|uniref:exopolysaccharide biosynthesis protein n=1 Tax=uncultured Methanobrevibacter sp. TaxID=253161 RepID=UPI0025CBCFC2|nr:exopolysaccharide biosynthesis protein [uncultured Methanobrevibacter sp.]